MQSSIPSILLVGAGRWGTNHLRIWLRLQAQGLCHLAGVYESDPARRQAISAEFNVPTFDDERGQAQADAVDIVVPTYHHFAVAKRMLLAGKDVLVEKPLTETVVQAEELARIQVASGRILMVGHLFRYNPALDYVKQLLTAREVGSIRFLRGRFMGFRFKEHDAGILATTAIHFIYLSNYLLGRPPEKVWAKVNYLLDDHLDDCSMVRLDYGQTFSLIESDYFTPGKWRTIDIVGSQGVICFDALWQKVELHQKKHIRSGERFETYSGSVLYPNIAFQEPLYLELSHFLECVRRRSEPLTGIRDGLEVLRIIAAAYQSSQTDQTITLTNLVSTITERS